MMRTLRGVSLALMVAATAVVAGGCSDDETTNTSLAGTKYGSEITMGNGKARSFVTLDASGNPTAVGVRMTEQAMQGLPASTLPSSYMPPLPAEASATAFNHVSIDWAVQGHPPAGVYNRPHFDIHFYTIDTASRNAIMTTDTNGFQTPAAGMVPADYFFGPPGSSPEAVPQMGIHYVDVTSPELDTAQHHTFDKTFIYGFWKGKMHFWEPMITRDYLTSKVNSGPITLKLPTVYAEANKYYPTRYQISFDATTGEHVVTLDGLVKR
jgi:hypothetical protein